MSEKKDNWLQYATEREDTAQAVIERHRGEIKSLLNLLAKDRGELQALRAQIGQGVPEIDYEALIAAAYNRDRKWAQGTNGCVAFKCGAEWFRSQMRASTPPAPKQKPLTDEQQIAEALRKHGFALVKTATGYDVIKLGPCVAHHIGEKK